MFSLWIRGPNSFWHQSHSLGNFSPRKSNQPVYGTSHSDGSLDYFRWVLSNVKTCTYCNQTSRVAQLLPVDTTAVQIGHCTNNGFGSKSADPYTFLTFALLSKNFLSSQAVKSFLSWSGSPSGHAESATLNVWEMGQFLHWLFIRCSVTSSRIASSLDPFESPYIYTLLHSLSTIFINTELLWFWDSRGNFDDNVAARKLCLALSTEWKH